MAARSVTCTLFNESASHDLTLVEATLEHGIWSRQGEPPGVVPRGSEGVWESESNGFMTGTEGRAVYAVGDSAVRVAFHWNNPFIGENSFSQRVVPPESGSPSGLHLEDVVAFDPVRDAPRGPRYLHDRPADPVHDDNVAIGFRFEVRGAKREAEHPVLAQGLPRPEEVRATTAPPGRRTTSRDATAFPQVVYCGLNFSACLTGYQKCSSPPRIFAMFPNLKTLWGYDYESPGATNAGPAPHCKSSNRSLVVWEAATRLSNDAEALNRASETLRESIFRATRSLAEGDSRIWTREGPLRVKEYEKKKSSRSAGA